MQPRAFVLRRRGDEVKPMGMEYKTNTKNTKNTKQIQTNTKSIQKNTTAIRTHYKTDDIREVSGAGFFSLKLTICPYIGSRQNTKKIQKQYNKYKKIQNKYNDCIIFVLLFVFILYFYLFCEIPQL